MGDNRRRVLLASDPFTGYNTFIGALGKYILTAADLEIAIGLNAGDITYFNLNVNDIECYINVLSYSIKADAFPEKVSSWDDQEGRLYRLQDRAFKNCAELVSINASNLTIIDEEALRGTGVVTLDFPNLETMNGQICMGDLVNCNEINIPKLIDCGVTVGDDGTFLNLKLGCNIFVPIALETINGGGVEGDIAYADVSRNANIGYIVVV